MLLLRGAPYHVFSRISAHVQAGQPQVSYARLSKETGYCVTTIYRTVRLLRDRGLISITPAEYGQPCTYAVRN